VQGASSSPVNVPIEVVPVNSPPTLDMLDPVLPPPIWTEGDGGVPIATTETPLADPDSDLMLLCHFAILNPLDGNLESLDVTVNVPSILASYNSANATLTLRGKATVEDFNRAITSIEYMSVSTNPTEVPRLIQSECIDDEGLPNDPVITELPINPTNTPPIVDLNGPAPGYEPSISYNEDDGEVPVLPLPEDFPIIQDPDSDTMEFCQAQIHGASPDEQLAVSALPCLIESEYDASKGLLRMQGPASVEEFERLLRSMTYENTAQSFPAPSERRIVVVCNDEEGACSNSPAIHINLQNVNDPPSLSLDGSAAGNFLTEYAEGEAPVPITGEAELILEDTDSDTLRECNVMIVDAPDGDAEVLSASVPFGCQVGVQKTNPGSMFLNGPAPIEEFRHVLSTVTYQNTETNPTPGERKVRFQCIDESGGVSRSVVSLVNVRPIDEAPVVDLSGGSILGINWEDSASNIQDATLISNVRAFVVDGDSNSLAYCQVRLPGPANAGEGFSLTTELAPSIEPQWIPGAGTLFLNGPASVESFSEAIRSVCYVRRGDLPYSQVDIQVQCVDEDMHASAVATSTMHIEDFASCRATTTSTDDGDIWLHLEGTVKHSKTTTSSSPFSYGSIFSSTTDDDDDDSSSSSPSS